jgi:hypothetical protein
MVLYLNICTKSQRPDMYVCYQVLLAIMADLITTSSTDLCAIRSDTFGRKPPKSPQKLRFCTLFGTIALSRKFNAKVGERIGHPELNSLSGENLAGAFDPPLQPFLSFTPSTSSSQRWILSLRLRGSQMIPDVSHSIIECQETG